MNKLSLNLLLEQCNDSSVSIKSEEFLDQLSWCQLLNNDFVPWSQLVVTRIAVLKSWFQNFCLVDTLRWTISDKFRSCRNVRFRPYTITVTSVVPEVARRIIITLCASLRHILLAVHGILVIKTHATLLLAYLFLGEATQSFCSFLKREPVVRRVPMIVKVTSLTSQKRRRMWNTLL